MTDPRDDSAHPVGPDGEQPSSGTPPHGSSSVGPNGELHQPYPPAPLMPGQYVQFAPEHPQAQTALILGILGLVLCQVVAPFAWVTGKRTLAEIDASGGRLGGRSQAQTGYILGIVGTVVLGMAVAFVLVYVVIFIVLVGGMAATAP